MAKPKSRLASSLLAILLWLPPAAPLQAIDVEVERLTGKAFAAGQSGDFWSRVVDMTPDGRYLLILTSATNVMAGFPDTNGASDLLVHDRTTGVSEWVTLSYHAPETQLAMSQIGSPAVISADGRYVAFASAGRPHAAGSTGEAHQLYLFDRQTRSTVKVSHPPGNPQGHGDNSSWLGLHLSHDGRYLSYESDATNLVTGTDANHSADVFQYDRVTGVSTLVSHQFANPANTAIGGSRLLDMSQDGRFLLFLTRSTDLLAGFVDNNGGPQEDAFLWDRTTNSSQLVSRSTASALTGADAEVTFAALAADGSRAAFVTNAGNLVAGFTDQNGGEADVFVFERAAGSVQLVSGVSTTTTQNVGSFPRALSADGGYVFFFSAASDVIPGLVRPADGGWGLFRFDTATREIVLINHKPGQPTAVALGGSNSVSVAADGEAVIFTSTSGELVAGQSAAGGWQVFASDLTSGTVRLISHLSGQPLAGALGDPVRISDDHRYVAFNSSSPQVVPGLDDNISDDPFLYDLELGNVSRVTNAANSGQTTSGGHFERLQSIPAAGLFLFHTNDVTPFLPGIVDGGGLDPVLVDPRSGAMTALFAPGGATPDGQTQATFLADGLNFLLRSSGSNLVPGITDGNGAGADLYAGNRTRGGLQLISSSGSSASTSANATVGVNLAFSENGRFVAYDTLATDAVAGVADTNGVEDVVLHDRQLGTRVLVSRAATGNVTGNGRSYPVAFSADGDLLLFASRATDLIPAFNDRNGALGEDYFLYRRSTGALTLVTHAAGSTTISGTFGSTSGKLTADGRFVFFVTTSRNLVAGGIDGNSNQNDVFGYDTSSGLISRISHVPQQPLRGVNGDVQLVDMSPDGRYLLLSSSATDLTTGTSIGGTVYNTFVYDRALDEATLVSTPHAQPTTAIASGARAVAMTDDARIVVFQTEALDVVPGQIFESLMHAWNLFLVDRATGERAIVSRSVSGPTATANAFAGQLVALGPEGREALFLSFATNLSPYVPYQATEVYLARMAIGEAALFRDGFESGNTGAWSQTLGGN